MTKIINHFIDQRKLAKKTGNAKLVSELDYIINSMAYIFIDKWADHYK